MRPLNLVQWSELGYCQQFDSVIQSTGTNRTLGPSYRSPRSMVGIKRQGDRPLEVGT